MNILNLSNLLISQLIIRSTQTVKMYEVFRKLNNRSILEHNKNVILVESFNYHS